MWTEVMNLASAYPNSALSAGALIALALVMAVSLALWLILVFRADQSGAKETRQAKSRLNVVAPGEAAEDKHSDAGQIPADRRHGAAA
jgi:hypothetical protein